MELCPLLHQLFSPDLKCTTSADSFSTPPILSERFSAAAAYQYFHPLPRLLHFQTTIARLLCGTSVKGPCVNEAAALSYASYLDIDFDAISHAVTLTAFWRADLPGGLAKNVPAKGGPNDKLEVGVLTVEPPDEAEEVKLGGYLTVIGEDSTPSKCPLRFAFASRPSNHQLTPTEPTLFSFPSRHQPLPLNLLNQTYTTNFPPPTGLHPTLTLTFPRPPQAPQPDCALHAYLTLPSALFLDPYALADPLTLSTHNLKALHALSGAIDLEAPDWTTATWGSAALLELAHPSSTPSPKDFTAGTPYTITIPTHLRYLPPNPHDAHGSATHANLTIPHPSIFYACPATEGLKFPSNPFDRTHLGYDALFGPRTMFYHIPPSSLPETASGGLVETLEVPVLASAVVGAEAVRLGTWGVVAAGVGWVGWMLFKGWRGEQRAGKGKGKGKRA